MRMTICGFVAVLTASALSAQPRITLIHGAGKTGADWPSSLLTQYNSQFPNATISNPPPTLYAGSLQSKLNNLLFAVDPWADSTVLVGFSLGGVLSRAAVAPTQRPGMRGVVTYNTPHGGLPMAYTLPDVLDHLNNIALNLIIVASASTYSNQFPGGEGGIVPEWLLQALYFAAFSAGILHENGWVGLLGTVPSDYPYLPDLVPTSSYIANLPVGTPGVHRNLVVSQTLAAAQSAPFSIFQGEYQAQQSMLALPYFAADLVDLGNELLTYADLYTFEGVLLAGSAYAAWNLAYWFLNAPGYACQYTTDQWPCSVSDGLVPVLHQTWPGASTSTITGPTHNFAMTNVNIHQAHLFGQIGALIQ
jgi:hypothetical protein